MLVTLLVLQLAPLQAAARYQTHKVKKGESLYRISKRYGVSVDQIKKLNNLRGNTISIGQNLKIKPLAEKKPAQPKPPAATPPAAVDVQESPPPAADTVAATPSREVFGNVVRPAETTPASAPVELPEDYYHIVQAGENLYRIGLNAGLTLPGIRKLNNFPEDYTSIRPGDRILIKDPASYQPTAGSDNPTGEEQPEVDPVHTQTAPPDSQLIEIVHYVQRKETLYRIAKDNNMTVEELKRINGLTSNSIRVGQKLYITPRKPGSSDETSPQAITEEDLKSKTRIRSDLVMPVEGKILSEFGIRNGRPHKGIDIGAPSGTPVYAVLEGTVVYSGPQGNYGNVVVIEHPNYVMTVYAHNEKNLVSVGDVVKQGQTIGTVGSTGNATGPHVHFEYRIKGKAINPRKVLPG